ncbi:polycomb protein Asx isoform X2 [Tribolium castaneum]|uniref:polycomb protein Asx isoform X2 n=1 Tax=Tribolium castaneum TaxID=7070 RepID=UPI00046BFF90|nr:PREDICTED: polycomb protein Asx isoform X2 [Tribolium castaneum]|eukprot:XP_008192915.1 PREDICTED: polycomb protein Asx isoform X2 [Tribolium castaneum]
MEIDVTPEASDGASSQGEEENAEKVVSEKAAPEPTKKAIKLALRQQAKRRKKNTTIASGNSSTVPRIIVKPLPPQPPEETPPAKAPTMREVLASIPGFTMKPRRRTNKKLSTAAQLEQTKEGCIDLETPDSILVNTNLRLLLNKATFASLPLLYQNKLVQLLPDVDRNNSVTNSTDSLELSNSGLNNEFFARACVEWQDRLAEGEFTPENQQKLKLEADKERSKLDPWKLKHFEPIWGDRSQTEPPQNFNTPLASRPPIKTTIKLRPTTTVTNKAKAAPPIKRLRTVGAMTRSCTSLKESEISNQEPIKTPIPDLLPIKSIRNQTPKDTSETQAEKQENCIINISKTILQTDEETIICSNNNKRRRSLSHESIDSKRQSLDDKVTEPCNTDPDSVDSSIVLSESDTKDEEEPSTDEKVEDEEPKTEPKIDEEEEEENPAPNLIEDSFPILPNSLILQQESIVLEKTLCDAGMCLEDSAEKLEASVEESDLVMAQLTESNFESVRNIADDDANEDRFIDAENYVLESGQITVQEADKEKERTEVDIEATLFGNDTAQAPTEGCCWDLVDSSTEKLLEVPLHALESVPAGIVGQENPTEHVEVIPMQEELEVRLEQGNFPVPNDWPYDVKMDSEMVAAALGTTDNDNATNATTTSNNKPNQNYQEFTGNQVKLELEVTLTPEIISNDSLITSTVSSSNGTNSTVTPSVSKTVTTVIPPTTIVCLPSVVSTSSLVNPPVNETQCPTLPRPGMVQSSSALPYLALSTSQPIRAVPAHTKSKPKNSQSSGSNRNRGSNKPPPGAVNLERSYQICQAVIQNSPNRDQLRCQLKPPPSLLAAAAGNNNVKKNENNRQTQYSSVTSSRGSTKTFTPPLPASGNFQMVQNNGVKNVGQKARSVPYQQQRQPSPPVVVRHVFTSGQGIPVTMAVLPQPPALSPEVSG